MAIKNDFNEAIFRSINRRTKTDTWLTVGCIADVIICLALAPSTMLLSLLGLMLIPITYAMGKIASESERQTEIQKLKLKLLTEELR